MMILSLKFNTRNREIKLVKMTKALNWPNLITVISLRSNQIFSSAQALNNFYLVQWLFLEGWNYENGKKYVLGCKRNSGFWGKRNTKLARDRIEWCGVKVIDCAPMVFQLALTFLKQKSLHYLLWFLLLVHHRPRGHFFIFGAMQPICVYKLFTKVNSSVNTQWFSIQSAEQNQVNFFKVQVWW